MQGMLNSTWLQFQFSNPWPPLKDPMASISLSISLLLKAKNPRHGDLEFWGNDKKIHDIRCDMTVWNRTKSKGDPLISLGAIYKPSPEEVAASCDVTFAMLADPQSAVEVACGKHGVVSGMSPGKGCVDVSTVDSNTSKLISGHIKATGVSFLEAPVSGSKKPAEDGNLIFLTAGNLKLQVCYKCTNVLNERSFHGQGNLSNRISSKASAEESVSQSAPTAAAANEPYKVAKSQGLGDSDCSAVIEALKVKLQQSAEWVELIFHFDHTSWVTYGSTYRFFIDEGSRDHEKCCAFLGDALYFGVGKFDNH